MIDLPDDLPRRYRYALNSCLRFGKWNHSYELVGARGGLHLHISGPHKYDSGEHWSAGLEFHSRVPLRDEPPSHDRCWLLDGPCWHDGTSLYAQEHYLPMVIAGEHRRIFLSLIHDADRYIADAARAPDAPPAEEAT